jgi:hypothetical protein
MEEHVLAIAVPPSIPLPFLHAALPLADVASVLALAALVAALWNGAATRRRLSRLQRLLNDPTTRAAIESIDRGLPALRDRLSATEQRLAELTPRTESALASVGLVRFRAYDTSGPALSFSLALLDRRGDGIVLTSLFGRSDARVYAKHVRAGVADAELSPEEAEALRLAQAGGGSTLWETPTVGGELHRHERQAPRRGRPS